MKVNIRCCIVDHVADQFNLRALLIDDLTDWCLIEIYKRALEPLSIRVLNHHRWDEGLIVMDYMNQGILLDFSQRIYQRYRRYRGLNVKMMVSGLNAILSVE